MGPRIDVRDVLVVVPHLIVTGTLVAMTVMQIPSTRAQLDSGYVPSWFGIELVMLGLAVVLAAVVAIEVGIWLRTGRRRGS
ncbi:MAG: hypothetical protein H0V73_06895 [Chloroflexi bacterium]|nr:hypothetical protein [Chloroflexota bacterium]